MPQSGRLQAHAHAADLELKAQGLQLVQTIVSHKFQALNFCYRVVLACELKLSGLLAGDSLARLFLTRLHIYHCLYVVARTLHKAMTC